MFSWCVHGELYFPTTPNHISVPRLLPLQTAQLQISRSLLAQNKITYFFIVTLALNSLQPAAFQHPTSTSVPPALRRIQDSHAPFHIKIKRIFNCFDKTCAACPKTDNLAGNLGALSHITLILLTWIPFTADT